MGIFPSFDEVMKKTPTKVKSGNLWPSFESVVKPPPPVYNKFNQDVSTHPYNPLNPANQIEAFPKSGSNFDAYQGTFKTLDELKADPLTLKKDNSWLKKTFTKAWEGLKAPIMAEGDRIAELFVNSKTTNEKVGNTIKATTGIAGIVFSPITALFEGANEIPILGTASKLISLPFTAVGEGGAQLGGTIVDKLPIPQDVKDKIKPGIEEIFALAGQLALGKVTAVAEPKFKSLVAKYGERDAVTIVAKAQELAKEKTTGFPQPQSDLKPTVVPKEFPKSNPAPKTAPTEAITSKPTEPPLLQEAKKYNSAEEFVKAQLSKEPTVTVYRGSKTGKVHDNIKDFTFFATNKEYAQQYMTKGEKLVEYKLPESSLLRDKINSQEVQYLTDTRNPKISQLTDIYNQAKGEVKTEPVKEGKVTKAASDINTALVKKGVEALTDEQQSKFTEGSYKDSEKKTASLMDKNIEEVKSMARGDTPVPNDIHPQILFNAVEALATKTNDIQLLRDLAASPLGTQLSEAGGTLGSHGFNDNPNSAVAKIREVAKARENTKAKTTAIKEIKTEIKKSLPKAKDWNSFIDQLKCT